MKTLKINKYIPKIKADELLADTSTNQILEHLNNISHRGESKLSYKKHITFNSTFSVLLNDNKKHEIKKEIIKGLLSYERAFYINTYIADTKDVVGNKYKIHNILKLIEQDLKFKNKYITYSNQKARTENCNIFTSAQGLLDIIATTADRNNSTQKSIINYMLEVYINILNYYEGTDIINDYIVNKTKIDEETFYTIQKMENMNSIFEVFRDMSNMIEESYVLEKHLKIVLIYFYENIENSSFFKEKIFQFDMQINQYANIKFAIHYRCMQNNKKDINNKDLLNKEFHSLFDSINLNNSLF